MIASSHNPVLAAATRILALLEEKPVSSLAISGGTSPKQMFELFAQSKFPWERVHLFWVDERGVPPTDPQSNYKLAFDAWLAPARFPASNIHRIEAELDPREAAGRYADDLRRHFGGLPQFDVIHRGMGPDAHTASLFPGEPLIGNHEDLAAAVWVEKMHQWRITLLPAVLEAARHTVMLVAGEDKAPALRSVFHEAYNPLLYPAQLGRPERLDWFLDDAAAQGLE